VEEPKSLRPFPAQKYFRKKIPTEFPPRNRPVKSNSKTGTKEKENNGNPFTELFEF